MKWVLSEKTLNLPEENFKSWMDRSKATPSSKRRYEREYIRYNRSKKWKTTGTPNTKTWIQKEASGYGRDVKTINVRIKMMIDRKNFDNRMKVLEDTYRQLLRDYKGKYVFMAFILNYDALIKTKGSAVSDRKRRFFKTKKSGFVWIKDQYTRSHIEPVSYVKSAMTDLRYKLWDCLSKESWVQLHTRKEIVKLYMDKQKGLQES